MPEEESDADDEIQTEMIGIRGADNELLDRFSIPKHSADSLRQWVQVREIEGEERPYIQLFDSESNVTIAEIQFTEKGDEIRTDVRTRDRSDPRYDRIAHEHAEKIRTSGAAALYHMERNFVTNPIHAQSPNDEPTAEIICPHCDGRNYLYGNPLNHELICDHCDGHLPGFDSIEEAEAYLDAVELQEDSEDG